MLLLYDVRYLIFYTTIKIVRLSVTEVGVAGWAASLHGRQT